MIALIDYGAGNLTSVRKALTSLDFFRNMEDAEEHQMEAAIDAIWK